MTDTWTLEPRSFASWNTERTGSTIRITDDLGYRRITEQGNLRIIEYMAVQWSLEPSLPINSWVTESVISAFDDEAFDPSAFE